MKDGLLVRKLNSDGSGQVIAIDFCFGFFKRPWDVVKISADGLAEAIAGEETVALHEEIFEGTAAGFGELAGWAEAAIARFEERGLIGEAAAAVEREFAFRALLEAHLRPVVGHVEEGACGKGGEEIAGVEGEAIDAWGVGVLVMDVGAEAEVRETACAGDGEEAADLDAIKPEGDDA